MSLYLLKENGDVIDFFSKKKVPKNEAEWIRFCASLDKTLMNSHEKMKLNF